MLKKFIERPVLSTVVSIILLILGGLSIFTLPISLFPDIAPPSILVSATYPGANAEVVARSVATPLEEAINGVENMTYMTSNSSNDGSMSLTVYFRQGTNADIAAVNVQNRVSKATSQIPAEVIQAGISTQKQQNSIIMFIGLYSTDSSYDETFLQNYAKINLIPKLQRIPGVADAQPFGTKDYSMRIWLKPDRLVAYNLSPSEVMGAIKDQSLEAAPGRFGQSSKEVYEYVLKYKGKLNKNEDYENVIVKSNSDGSVIRLKDVARVEFGSYTYSSNSSLNGNPTTGIAIQQVAGSNANDILTEAEKRQRAVGQTKFFAADVLNKIIDHRPQGRQRTRTQCFYHRCADSATIVECAGIHYKAQGVGTSRVFFQRGAQRRETAGYQLLPFISVLGKRSIAGGFGGLQHADRLRRQPAVRRGLEVHVGHPQFLDPVAVHIGQVGVRGDVDPRHHVQPQPAMGARQFAVAHLVPEVGGQFDLLAAVDTGQQQRHQVAEVDVERRLLTEEVPQLLECRLLGQEVEQRMGDAGLVPLAHLRGPAAETVRRSRDLQAGAHTLQRGELEILFAPLKSTVIRPMHFDLVGERFLAYAERLPALA